MTATDEAGASAVGGDGDGPNGVFTQLILSGRPSGDFARSVDRVEVWKSTQRSYHTD